MSIGVHGNCRTTASYNLSDTVQPTCSITLGGNIEHVYEKHNQSNERNKSGQSCESDKCTCDPGTNATCTCTGTPSGTATGRSSTTGHTSFPCPHCRDHDPRINSLVRKHKYTVLTSAREFTSASDYIERDYAEYISATSTQGQGAGAGVRNSIESRNSKQADANSTDSIERRTGIPAGVTI